MSEYNLTFRDLREGVEYISNRNSEATYKLIDNWLWYIDGFEVGWVRISSIDLHDRFKEIKEPNTKEFYQWICKSSVGGLFITGRFLDCDGADSGGNVTSFALIKKLEHTKIVVDMDTKEIVG